MTVPVQIHLDEIQLHPVLDPPIAYNIAHDSSLVVMAFQRNARNSLEIGADVMRVALPKGVTLSSFIDILTEQVRSSRIMSPQPCS
jgi:hypothetical protein